MTDVHVRIQVSF